ncbi:hypothetical protein AMK30_18060 [Streptomyces sp. CB02460]|nr:hypothetical protein AMK30_18060 [Streptomyces sp. CB02460]
MDLGSRLEARRHVRGDAAVLELGVQTSALDAPSSRSAAAARAIALPWPRRPGPADRTVTVATAWPFSSRPSRQRASVNSGPSAIARHPASATPGPA